MVEHTRDNALFRWNALFVSVVAVTFGASGANAQGTPDALDLIADGTYVGTIDTTTAGFRDNATVTSSSSWSKSVGTRSW